MPIALLTDFGSSDGYVGSLKGVALRIAPDTPVIDISHDIPAFDILEGAVVLFRAFAYFPKKTIFVVVVDPGVGSERKPILVETADYYFVAPDNGVLTLALAEQKIQRIIHLMDEKYFLQPRSHTFHGRDIFIPVAAHLVNGAAVKKFGAELSDYVRLPALEPQISAEAIHGQVIAVDRFGNIFTNLTRRLLERYFSKMDFTLFVGAGSSRPGTETKSLQGLHSHYAEGEPGQAMLLFSSSNLLEIAVNQGSAAEILGLQRGDKIKIAIQHHLL
jgi:S-adenosyl-L-methionine hydrolase (adenosine-forming)